MGLTASGIWYPDGNFTANPRVIAAQQAANLESVISGERLHHGSVEYASQAARDLANPTPQQGDQCTVVGVPMTYFTSGGWQTIKTTQSPITPAPATFALAWTSVANVATPVLTQTIDAQPIATLCMFSMQYTGVLTGTGYVSATLVLNGASLMAVREGISFQTASGTYVYKLAANTALTVAVTVITSASATTSTVSTNTVFNFLRWTLVPA